jgi:hypothetical protein
MKRRRVRRPKRWLGVAIVTALLIPILLIAGGSLLLATSSARVHAVYVYTIVDTGKEPAFLLTLAFLLTFGLVRLITYSIRNQWLPFFHDVQTAGGLHVHHMVPGLMLVLISGYLSLISSDSWAPRLLAVAFGIGAALVLDEFALLLNLADVYWEPAGRESIDAVVLAGGISILYVLGGGFWSRLLAVLLGAR